MITIKAVLPREDETTITLVKRDHIKVTKMVITIGKIKTTCIIMKIVITKTIDTNKVIVKMIGRVTANINRTIMTVIRTTKMTMNRIAIDSQTHRVTHNNWISKIKIKMSKK